MWTRMVDVLSGKVGNITCPLDSAVNHAFVSRIHSHCG